jgi:thymidylate synthase (FAD)
MMQIVKPEYEVIFHVPEGFRSLEMFIENVARKCYKSEDKITDESAPKFVRNVLMKRRHLAMIEHSVASVWFQADRGFTHELVRHRLASFAQESTRYCNYSKGKFGGEIRVIAIPESENPSQELLDHWQNHAEVCEKAYFKALELSGNNPNIARMFLPIGLKTEITMTANLREWHTVFGLRAAKAAHPIMRGLARKVLREFHKRVPSIYKRQYCEMMPKDDLTLGELEYMHGQTVDEVAKLEIKLYGWEDAINKFNSSDR